MYSQKSVNTYVNVLWTRIHWCHTRRLAVTVGHSTVYVYHRPTAWRTRWLSLGNIIKTKDRIAIKHRFWSYKLSKYGCSLFNRELVAIVNGYTNDMRFSRKQLTTNYKTAAETESARSQLAHPSWTVLRVEREQEIPSNAWICVKHTSSACKN